MLFFLAKFVGSHTIGFERVRNSVVFQLFVIGFFMLSMAINNKGRLRSRKTTFSRYIFPMLVFVVVNIIIGSLYGHVFFQCLIDAYKYLEIIIIYMFFRMCWEDNYELKLGIKSLSVLMYILGVIELFITARGGVGLNILISIFPIILLDHIIEQRNKGFWWLLLLAAVIVFRCETRTYIAGFAIGYVVLVLISPRFIKRSLISKSLLLVIVGSITLLFFGSKLFAGTLERFSGLSSGFSESGGYRIDEFVIAIQKFKDHPIIGNGFGYLQYMFVNKMGYIYWGDFIHDVYIEILFKTGLIGACCTVFYIYSIFRDLHSYNISFTNAEEFGFTYCVTIGALCAFVSWLAIYTLAPLSSYGTVFIGPIIAYIANQNYNDELTEVEA